MCVRCVCCAFRKIPPGTFFPGVFFIHFLRCPPYLWVTPGAIVFRKKKHPPAGDSPYSLTTNTLNVRNNKNSCSTRDIRKRAVAKCTAYNLVWCKLNRDEKTMGSRDPIFYNTTQTVQCKCLVLPATLKHHIHTIYSTVCIHYIHLHYCIRSTRTPYTA